MVLVENRTVVLLAQHGPGRARKLYRNLDFTLIVRLIHEFSLFNYTLTQRFY
jgi:hypothetical protein